MLRTFFKSLTYFIGSKVMKLNIKHIQNNLKILTKRLTSEEFILLESTSRTYESRKKGKQIIMNGQTDKWVIEQKFNDHKKISCVSLN